MISDYREDTLASKGDLYVVAIGTSDVRYRNEETCSMTEEEYVRQLGKMADLILLSNPNAEIVFLAPWMTLENDTVSQLSHEEKMAMTAEYAENLQLWSAEKGYQFIDPNGYLIDYYEDVIPMLYTDDGIHPNETIGVELYSKAVLESSK